MARMARVVVNIKNSVMNFLKFTVEVQDHFIHLKLLTLDVKFWMSNGLH